jgi:hypothetical protein
MKHMKKRDIFLVVTVLMSVHGVYAAQGKGGVFRIAVRALMPHNPGRVDGWFEQQVAEENAEGRSLMGRLIAYQAKRITALEKSNVEAQRALERARGEIMWRDLMSERSRNYIDELREALAHMTSELKEADARAKAAGVEKPSHS